VSDLTITQAGARAQVEANNDAGVEFVDAWTGAILDVIDSGIITVPSEAMLDIEKAAKREGLSFDIEEGAP
jgi:hypothetical protein